MTPVELTGYVAAGDRASNPAPGWAQYNDGLQIAPGCEVPDGRRTVECADAQVGVLCIVGNAGQGEETFSVNQRMRLSVGVDVLQSCRPLCDTPVSSRCDLTRDGNTFRVSGAITVDVECGDGDPPPACSAPTVECLTEPLAAGDYVVTDGTRTLDFRVPSTLTTPIPCAPR
ncbi:MAG: hypothetical protein JWM10_1217 [Myxococcaceae bacterium]|nr:hypothetical protein [Myxococcaceae bacterium]